MKMQTLYRAISGEEEIITEKDFFEQILPTLGDWKYNGDRWYAINSHPHYPTHTVINGKLTPIENAYAKFFGK